MSSYVVLWIDHKEARVFHIHPDKIDSSTVSAPRHNIHHKHPRGLQAAKEHPADAKQFFDDVTLALEGAEQVLVVGPSTAKLEFLRYVHQYGRALEPRIVGVETVDHPTDGQLVAYAKKYFGTTDRVP